MKKGFTLIELLAVIVILAIIALIATPIVLDIIEDSKNSSIKRSAELYLDAVEQAIATSVMNDGLEDGTYIIDSKGNLKYKDKTIKVDVKNYNFESGTVIIEQGQIKDIKLSNNEKVTTGKELTKIDKWDGKTVTEVTADSNGIYHITKASELAWVAQKVNSGETFAGKTISLDASLDLGGRYDKDGNKLGTEWIPIGTKKSDDELFPFKGTFEGNNNVISGIYINKPQEDLAENQYLGLFGYSDAAIIRSLVMKDSYIKGYSNIGVVCGRVFNGGNINNIVVDNIYVDSIRISGVVVGATHTNISLSNLYSYNSEIKGGDIYIGGVVGAAQINCSLDNIYGNSTVSNTNEARLTATGGIIGGMIKESRANNLVSEATVSGYSGVGGITGQIQQNSIITNSVSYATVSGMNIIGGIIGMNASNSGGVTLENIKSYASIIAKGEYIGGVIGQITKGENSYDNIYSKAKVKGKDKVGGIIGGFSVDEDSTLNYKNIVSEATVEGETNKGELWGYVDAKTVLNSLD